MARPSPPRKGEDHEYRQRHVPWPSPAGGRFNGCGTLCPPCPRLRHASWGKALPGPAGSGVRPFGGQNSQPGLRPEAGRGGGVPHRVQPLSTQDDVAAGLASLGWRLSASTAWTPRGYEDLLIEALKCHPTSSSTTGGSHRPAGGQVQGIRRLPAGGVRGDHHRHPPPESPGEGRPAPLPHGSGERRQGQTLL